LAFEVESELRNLAKVVEELTDFLHHAPAEPPKVQVQGTAKYLHDFYNGVERIFERVAVRLDEDLPAAAPCHLPLATS
jgi:hypothetical protein